MEESEHSQPPQEGVLIIPLHPNATPSSDATPPSGCPPKQDTATSSPTHQTPSPASPQTTPTASVSSSRGTAGLGSQLFAELLESHARRSPRTASPEPPATPPNMTTPPSTPPAPPQSLPLSLGPTTPPQQQSPTIQGGGQGLSSPELLKELKQPHTLKHVSAHKGLTTVFSGRGRTPTSPSSPNSDSGGGAKPSHLSNGTQH